MKKEIADIRRDYKMQSLLETELVSNPIDQFGKWWDEAIASEIDEVNAMTLATTTRNGAPSARIVLLKGYTDDGFIFYTNYQSHKALDLAENPRAALVFFWKELERQIRVEGVVSKISEEESDQYFNSRPSASRIGAWASPQSKVVENRDWIEANYLRYAERFKEEDIPRPGHWGGYIVKPVLMEFWQGRRSRLHDRLQYSKDQDTWKIERLAP